MDTLTATFDVTIQYAYTEMVIPPRGRKPRPQESTDTHIARVRQVPTDQAPVVIRVPVRDLGMGIESLVDLRGHDGRLYAPLTPPQRGHIAYPAGPPVRAGSEHFPAHRDVTTVWDIRRQPREAALARLDAQLGAHVIIDGGVWVRVGEPVYEVVTFGSGFNTGATLLTITQGVRTPDFAHPATDFDEAVAQAVQVAVERGDTDSVTRIRTTRPIEVLDASYVTAAHQQDVRTGREVALASKIDTVKALLTGPSDEAWFTRILEARRLLDEAADMAGRL